MADQQLPPAPPSSGPLPPWLHKPTNPVPPPTPSLQVPTDIPGPWSRPAPLKHAAPAVPPPPSASQSGVTKDWGPIKPIRTVPKPSEQKVAYIIAQTEHVVDPDAEHARKRWIIVGSIVAFLVIVGGTFAFIFFGRNSQEPKLDSNGVTIVNTNGKSGNVNTSDVFPSANTYRNVNASNANGSSNTNATVDSDGDGLTDKQEALYGTNASNVDTDGDGYTDGQEVQGGYNPLGAGKL
jgi:hypothetical protein